MRRHCRYRRRRRFLALGWIRHAWGPTNAGSTPNTIAQYPPEQYFPALPPAGRRKERNRAVTEYTPSAKTMKLVTDLTARFPGLRPLFADHLRDQFNQVLPYIFLSEVAQYLIELVERGDEASLNDVRAILDFFEEAFINGEEREERDLIGAGFLEAFPRRDERGAALRGMLGPVLRKQLATTYGVGD
jgi:hypothetical protein